MNLTNEVLLSMILMLLEQNSGNVTYNSVNTLRRIGEKRKSEDNESA